MSSPKAKRQKIKDKLQKSSSSSSSSSDDEFSSEDNETFVLSLPVFTDSLPQHLYMDKKDERNRKYRNDTDTEVSKSIIHLLSFLREVINTQGKMIDKNKQINCSTGPEQVQYICITCRHFICQDQKNRHETIKHNVKDIHKLDVGDMVDYELLKAAYHDCTLEMIRNIIINLCGGKYNAPKLRCLIVAATIISLKMISAFDHLRSKVVSKMCEITSMWGCDKSTIIKMETHIMEYTDNLGCKYFTDINGMKLGPAPGDLTPAQLENYVLSPNPQFKASNKKGPHKITIKDEKTGEKLYLSTGKKDGSRTDRDTIYSVKKLIGKEISIDPSRIRLYEKDRKVKDDMKIDRDLKLYLRIKGKGKSKSVRKSKNKSKDKSKSKNKKSLRSSRKRKSKDKGKESPRKGMKF